MTTVDTVLTIELAGKQRQFAADALPVSFGGDRSNDVVLGAIDGSVRIDQLDGVFFVQPGRGTTNARLDGERLTRSQRIPDGGVIALDTARLTCRLRDGRLEVAVEALITAGDTAPPDFAALTREEAGEVTVSPVAFRQAVRAESSSLGSRLPTKTALAVYVGFVVLVVVTWFAFTAKSVRFEFTPEADSVELSGTWFKLHIRDQWLVRQGEHRVVATAPGYHPIDQVVTVGDGANQVLPFEFVRLPGLVAFATEPATAAEVRLDGELIGTAPIADFEVEPGTHQVQFIAERYLSELVTVEVEGGHARQTVKTWLTPSWAPVQLSSRPAGAEIRVDGRVLGVTPAAIELTAGDREVEVALAGYNSWNQQIRVVADEPQTLPEIVLEVADGRLSLATTPADATITLNGQFSGRTPRDLRVPPNVVHRVSLAKPGYSTATLEIRVAPGQLQPVQVELKPELGVLEVRSTPAGAEVLIDGEPVGVTPLTVERMTVEQEVAVRLEGYAGQEERITPRPGYAQTLEFPLVTLDVASGGGFDREVTTGFGQLLVLVPAPTGEFQMGSSRAEPDRRQNEALRRVTLSKGFYLAATEMTNAQFREHCASDHDSGTFERQSLNGDDQPVVNVTIQQIYACLNKLSLADGLQPVYREVDGVLRPHRPLRSGYRLATEAEFEWAMRGAGRDAASLLRFSWGETMPPPDRYDNIADLSAGNILELTLVTYTDGQAVSAPVGSFEPNAVGLYDMGGNVAEWVQDIYDARSVPSEEVLADPLGPDTGNLNTIRGPSWQSALERQLRLSYRDYDNGPRPDVGFRIARNLQ